MSLSIHIPETEIGYNSKIKTYPDGSTEILVSSRPVFGRGGWEIEGEAPPRSRERRQEGGAEAGGDTRPPGAAQGVLPNPSNVERACRRARARVRDICLCTDFRFFVTLTVSRDQADRYDMESIWAHMRPWLSNQVQRRGLKYVLVPEHHKDGAIHFHGFINDALEIVDSGTLTKTGWSRPRRPRSEAQRAEWIRAGAHPVYNLPGWPLGFTTAIQLYGEYRAAVAYVCKYVGKDMRNRIGGRWYFSGGKLGAPCVDYVDLRPGDLDAVPVHDFEVRAARAHFWLYHFEGD